MKRHQLIREVPKCAKCKRYVASYMLDRAGLCNECNGTTEYGISIETKDRMRRMARQHELEGAQ